MTVPKLVYRITLVVAMLATPAAAFAQNFTYDITNLNANAKATSQAEPGYPRASVRRGQEGWVLLNFVVTPDGHASDPIVVDSTGGAGFEDALREILSEWRFDPPGSVVPNNMVRVRTELKRGRDMATSNFLRRYRRIVTHLHHEETPEARAAVDQAQALGGWNLYETTMLHLMLGRVDGAEGNMAGKLENYHRALRVSNRNSLDGEDRRDLLMRIFLMEMDAGQYSGAWQSLGLLKKEPDNASELARLADRIAELEQKLVSDKPLRARATISTPCDCEDGEPLWTYRPSRNTFSFANLEGNVERFDVRCRNERLQGVVESDKQWKVSEDVRFCRVFVFGDNGASFEFVESK